MREPTFLAMDDVLIIHEQQLERHGGQDGARDLGLLQSAVAMPQASFGGEYLHGDLFEMAAAYAFHICENHPFFDGNKRTALAAALVFLDVNGVAIRSDTQALYRTMMALAAGNMDKQAFSNVLRSLRETQPQNPPR